MWDLTEDVVEKAAIAISEADALLVSAGAGMGVDSGLPDFRGNEGFWNAYPPFRKLGVSFVDMANPGWFTRDPELAWGFYGHRLGLYRATDPHEGFQIIRRWAEGTKHGPFVFTSNVDGHFQKAGFDHQLIYECHGSLHHLQCTGPCRLDIWRAEATDISVDESTFRAQPALPQCPACGALARPNVLMFGDWNWIPHRSHAQESRFATWLESATGSKIAVVEMGAGSAVPTVRLTSEQVASRYNASLIRINPREPQAPRGEIGISAGALESLQTIDAKLTSL
jgi:NAD-dependent SIR2 family protein deacetylase